MIQTKVLFHNDDVCEYQCIFTTHLPCMPIIGQDFTYYINGEVMCSEVIFIDIELDKNNNFDCIKVFV